MLPRSVRNCNPCSIRVGAFWKGLKPPELMNAAQKEERAFCVFSEPKWGFRAAAVLLRSYKHLYGIDTIAKAIERFAPANENNTQAYISAVSRASAYSPNQVVDFSLRSVLYAVVKPMAIHETGAWAPYWTDQELSDGLDLMDER